MRINKLLPVIILFFLNLQISAQQRTCASYEVIKEQMAADPDYAR